MSVQNITEDFIGRRDEIGIFEQWLANSSIPQLLYFYDAIEDHDKKGGIGKTRLLHKCIQLINDEHPNLIPISIDFFNVLDRDGIVVAERIVQGLQKRYTGWVAESFDKTLGEYRRASTHRKTDMAEVRERLGNALAADLNLLREQMLETDTYLIVFFDTFELIEHNPITAVLRPYQTFPDNYYFDRILFVMAGRNSLNWSHQNWVGRENEVLPVPLSPFKDDEAVQFLSIKADLYDLRNVPPKILRTLNERTETRPILLGLVADVLNQKRPEGLEQLIEVRRSEFEASLVGWINEFENPIKWAIFFMAHIYHRFDATLLELIMQRPTFKKLVPKMEYQQLLETLPGLSFVRRSGSSDDFVLHDEMRRLVNKYCWKQQDSDGRLRHELSEVAIDYYAIKLAQVESEEVRQSYIVEMLYHQLVKDLQEGFKIFYQHFNRAVDLSIRSFARSLLQEAKKFESNLSLYQRRSMQMGEARLLQEEENPEAALQIYEALESDVEWTRVHYSDILYQKGNCYEDLSRLTDAIVCFNSCLEIEETKGDQKRLAEIFGQLGYIYRRLGLYSEAMQHYRKSLALLKNLNNPQEYATMLNNISNVYRLQGKVEEALRYCKLGFRIRRDLFARGKVSELDIGLSLSTMGLIYKERDDISSAERRFDEAFDIFNRIGYRKGVALTYTRLGQLLLTSNDLEEALEYFVQAHRIAFGIDQEARIDSLNGQGRVFALQGEHEKATEYFNQAVELARQVGDSYHQVENLLALAESLEHLEQPTDRILKEARQISAKNNYYLLSGQAEEIQGDFKYKAGNYRDAFKHYRIACKYLAQHNTLQFEKILRKLVDLLLDMPRDLLPGIVDLLLEYWNNLDLDKTFPALLDTCKEVRRYMDFND